MSEVALNCPKCGEPCASDSHFCEACGTPLKESAPVPETSYVSVDPTACKCGATAENRDADGFCLVCGRKFEPRDPRDHIECVMEGRLAAVTDKGIRHSRNEDDFSIGLTPGGAVIVVSDGVSSGSNSQLASALASKAAMATLVGAVEAGDELGTVMKQAILDAHNATLEVPLEEAGKHDPPGATIVAAVVVGLQITIGWAGDSRAYWLGDTQSIQLSKDHSWMQQVVDAGQMTSEQAEKDPRAHAITQCIGPLNEGPPESSVASFTIGEPGYLLVCTDGLWGYEGSPRALNTMLGHARPLEAARKFVNFAISRGGIDNVTAAIFHITSS